MKRALTFVLTIIVMILGALIVFVNPLEPAAIIFGMFMVSAAILSMAIQVYFPPAPEQTVELRVVEEPIRPARVPLKAAKPRKGARKNKKR